MKPYYWKLITTYRYFVSKQSKSTSFSIGHRNNARSPSKHTRKNAQKKHTRKKLRKKHNYLTGTSPIRKPQLLLSKPELVVLSKEPAETSRENSKNRQNDLQKA
jgi:hypothetical protein